MNREVFALALWSLLALSLLLTWHGLFAARWQSLALAAALSLLVAIPAMFSIGPFLLLLALLQAGAAVALKRGAGPRGWLAALGLPAGLWLATIGALLAPYWF